jgi:hypothetical protein
MRDQSPTISAKGSLPEKTASAFMVPLKSPSVFVRFDQVARFIVNANHRIM